jgi:hypothetical protein
MLTRLGMLNVDAFTIMKTAGPRQHQISQRYVHPSLESVESTFQKLEVSNQFQKLEVSNQLPPRKGEGIRSKSAVRRNRRKILK